MSKQSISKRCPKCKEIKPISEFWKSKQKGFQCYCKLCAVLSVKKYQKTNKSKTYQKRYFQSKKGRAFQKQYRQSKKGKITNLKAAKKYIACHPEQIKPKSAVNQAVIADKIPRPDTLQCHYGAHPAEVYHHHKGYAPEHWLDVVPICRKCHKFIHNNIYSSSTKKRILFSENSKMYAFSVDC